MANEKEVLHGLLTQAYGFNEEGVASLYNEDKTELAADAIEKLLEADRNRIAKLKPDEKKIRDEVYGRATREVRESFEKQIREKYQLKSDKQGVELIDDLVETFRSEGGGAGLTDDQIKKSKLFLDFAEQARNEKQTVITEYENKLNQFKAEVADKETWYTAKEAALTYLDSLNPILPKDPSKAQMWKEIYLNELKGVKREIRDGKIVLLDESGNDLQDGHGQRVSFETKAKEIADKLFEYSKGNERNDAPAGGGSGGPRKFVFTSEDDFMSQMDKEGDPAIRGEMSKAWFAQRKSS